MTYAEVNSIMVLGDSVSKGVVFNKEKKRYTFSDVGFIKKLTTRLRPEVIDFSRFGTTTSYGSKILSGKMQEFDPDLVLLEYGNNDCDFQWEEVAANPHGTHLPNNTIRQFTGNIRGMIDKIRGMGKIPIVTNLHPLDGERYFNWFSKNDPAMQKSILKWLKRPSNVYWWHEQYSNALEHTAKAMGVVVLNVRNAFLREPDYRVFICEDGIHPNEAGHEIIENVFMDAINRRAAGLL